MKCFFYNSTGSSNNLLLDESGAVRTCVGTTLSRQAQDAGARVFCSLCFSSSSLCRGIFRSRRTGIGCLLAPSKADFWKLFITVSGRRLCLNPFNSNSESACYCSTFFIF